LHCHTRPRNRAPEASTSFHTRLKERRAISAEVWRCKT
jgi:hypothetical protein